MASKGLKGYEKAAIVLMSMDEAAVSDMLKGLHDDELEALATEFSRLQKVPREQVEEVMSDFNKQVSASDDYLYGDEEFLKKAMEKAVGPQKAREIMGRSLESFTGIESLRRLDAKTIANFLKGEHPQTLALILSNIDSEQASQVVPLLPEEYQAEIILRMASMDGVPPAVLREVEEVIRNNFQDAAVSRDRAAGGLEAVVNILNLVDKGSEERIMGEVDSKDPDLADAIRKLMFVFDDLAKVDDKSIQTLLKEISTDELAIALKSVSEDVKQAFFRNMSERAAQIMQEDMEAKGPVRLSEVERAQQEIIKTARNLEAEGKIILGKGGEEIAY